MTHRCKWHGKLAGNHSTVIEAGLEFLPKIITDSAISRISPGFIKAGRTASGRKQVKIIDAPGCILLSIKGAAARQEIRVFTANAPAAKIAIARAARNAGFDISFETRYPQVLTSQNPR